MSGTLNKYEGMFLFHQGLLGASTTPAQGLVKELLEKYGATPVKVEVWDERKLAYPIMDQKRGTYVLSHFEAPSEVIDKINTGVRISDIFLRWLCVRHESKFPDFKIASEMEGARSRRDSDRDDGEGGERRGRREGGRGRREAPVAVIEDVPDLSGDDVDNLD